MCVYGGKVGEGGEGILGEVVCVCMCICIKYLAEIYLNTQEADTECRKFELTDLIIFERSHVLVTYQTLAY